MYIYFNIDGDAVPLVCFDGRCEPDAEAGGFLGFLQATGFNSKDRDIIVREPTSWVRQ